MPEQKPLPSMHCGSSLSVPCECLHHFSSSSCAETRNVRRHQDDSASSKEKAIVMDDSCRALQQPSRRVFGYKYRSFNPTVRNTRPFFTHLPSQNTLFAPDVAKAFHFLHSPSRPQRLVSMFHIRSFPKSQASLPIGRLQLC